MPARPSAGRFCRVGVYQDTMKIIIIRRDGSRLETDGPYPMREIIQFCVPRDPGVFVSDPRWRLELETEPVYRARLELRVKDGRYCTPLVYREE